MTQTNTLRCCALLTALASASAAQAAQSDLGPALGANSSSLRDYRDELGSYDQTGGEIWTFLAGSHLGTLLQLDTETSAGGAPGGWTAPSELGGLPAAGFLTAAAVPLPGTSATPTFDGVFAHPGATSDLSAAIVYTVQDDRGLESATLFGEMIFNTEQTDGVDINVSVINSAGVSPLGATTILPGSPLLDGALFDLSEFDLQRGDLVLFDVESRGNNSFDQANLEIVVTVPAPGTLCPLALAVLATRRRRA